MENGLGFKRLIPPLDPEAFVQRRSQLVCTVLTGVNDSISGSFMPAYAHLSDIQISNVLNFIRHTAALPGKAFTDAEVSEGRSLCE